MLLSRAWLSTAAKVLLTWAVSPVERRKAARMQADRSLRLHLGSADNRLPGWVNIDLVRPGRKLDLSWNVKHGLPFQDGSIDAIFAEHLLEHFTFDEGVALLAACHRVLRPGGVVRIGVPDLDRYVASYLGRDDLIDHVRPGRGTRGLALGEVFYVEGHRCMYDYETLRLALHMAGFAHIERRSFGSSRILPAPDSEARRAETLYAEATTPGLRGTVVIERVGPRAASC